jgi:N-acetylglutamate synthase-like GNAT family acetyltransferase
MKYTFRTAETGEDFEGIRRLNHRIFAEEIGQHAPTGDGRLIDARETQSRFTIALCEGEVVGMVAVSPHRPFSVEKRLPGPGIIESLGRRPLEVRLLAIAPAHRNGMLMAGLLGRMVLTAMEQGHDVLLISGVEERVALYERLGFRKLGPAIPEGNAAFYPMALKLDDLPDAIRRDIALYRRRGASFSPPGTSVQPHPPPETPPDP